MGNTHKKPISITTSECEEFSSISKFKQEEIKYILYHFRNISKLKLDDGVIDYQEFLETLNAEDSIVAKQLFNFLDVNSDGRINFREFIIGLNFLLDEDQLGASKVLFKVFDLKNKQGFGTDEIFEVIYSCVKMFQYVRISPMVLRKMIRNNMVEFEGNVRIKLEEPGLSLQSRELLEQILGQLRDFESFQFNQESFFIFFKFYPACLRWFQVDLDLIKQSAFEFGKVKK